LGFGSAAGGGEFCHPELAYLSLSEKEKEEVGAGEYEPTE
jgi:hypothetical protein